ncbi:ABC transporter permease [candidate division KSB1 bacterium]|nr:ABC transporter permease [candidate division KSB1 bacterium]
MSRKIFAIIGREYMTRFKTKGFIIGTLVFPLILVFIFGGVFIFGKLLRPTTRVYYVIDWTNQIYQEFAKSLDGKLSDGTPEYQFTEVKVTPDSLDAIIKNFQDEIRNKKADGYLIIPENVLDSAKVRYSARNVSNFEEQSDFEKALSRIVTNKRLERKGFTAEDIRNEMNRGRVELVSQQVTQTGEVKKGIVSSFVLTYILAYLILLMIMGYGQMVMRSVIEEKSQRITEMILSSVSPFELMMGKIIGICGLGLTQLAVVGLMILVAVVYSAGIFAAFGGVSPGFISELQQIQFSLSVFGFMLIFFFLGFFFFAAMYAAIGAMVNTEDEGQQFQLPLIFVILMGYFIMFTVIKTPDTASAFWISLIPFVTPLVMFARIAVSDPLLPSGAILSIFTMTFSTVLMVYLSAKIYRIGILMYGKKASLVEAIKWIRY